MKLFGKMLLPVIIIFIGVNIIIFAASGLLTRFNIDKNVLLGANLLFLLVSIFVFFMQQKAIINPNPNVFIRSVIGGMMIKMFSTVIAVLIYVTSVENYNKKAVFISLVLYLFYLGAEVGAISKQLRKK